MLRLFRHPGWTTEDEEYITLGELGEMDLQPCNCCKRYVPAKELYTKGNILFNGCKQCYEYLSELMANLKPNKQNSKGICVCGHTEWCQYCTTLTKG